MEYADDLDDISDRPEEHDVHRGVHCVSFAHGPEVEATNAAVELIAIARVRSHRIASDRLHCSREESSVARSPAVAPALHARREDAREIFPRWSGDAKASHWISGGASGVTCALLRASSSRHSL